MSEQIPVNEVEKKARVVLRQDGLATIIAGFAFAVMAPFFLDDRLGFLLILGTGLYFFLPEILRKRLVYPRVGYVKFAKKASKFWKLVLSILLLIVFVIVLKFTTYRWLLPLYLGVVFGVMGLTIGYVYRTVVEYLIAALILLSGLIGLCVTMQGNDPGTVAAFQLWIVGAVLVLVGVIQFVLFIQKDPLTEEHPDEATN
jgi:uncharacterized membrane protein